MKYLHSNSNHSGSHQQVIMCRIILSKFEGELFSFLPGKPQSYILAKEEWQAMRNPAEDRSIIVKPTDKGSCGVVWDREDYLA